MRGFLGLIVVAALAASPAAAGTPGDSTSKKPAAKYDPNRIDCRTIEHTGSRFKRYRVCMTVAEWENSRQRDRQAVERIQSSTCVGGAGC